MYGINFGPEQKLSSNLCEANSVMVVWVLKPQGDEL
jgi:hypothetical protein